VSHKDTAKALAMLVLENDDLYGDLVKAKDERDTAQSRAEAYAREAAEARQKALQECEAELWEVATQRDKALQEVNELRLVMKGQWLKIKELGGKVPPLKSHIAPPERDGECSPCGSCPRCRAALELVQARGPMGGGVVSEHGPCDGEGRTVRDALASV